jgi:hypothetical protein
MQVMIDHEHGVEFQLLCEHYLGHRGEFVQDFMVNTAPGVAGRMCIYRVPDASALATYIHLAHPEWIDYVWANHNKTAQVIDPNDTFLQLDAKDRHDRA